VVIVCPTNKLCQETNKKDDENNEGDADTNKKDGETKEEDDDVDAVTYNHFFGVGLTDESHIKRFNDSAYDVVVFDEICMLGTRMLARVKQYSEKHPEKIVIGTGDTSQLEPIEPMTNTYTDTEAYANSCVDLILPYQLYFRENKRLKTPEDKAKLRDFKRDIFDESIPKEVTVYKYFPVLATPATDFNIAYYHDTCKVVAKDTRKRMGKKTEYEVGESLVCRRYFKCKKTSEWKGTTFFKNYEYKITDISGNIITLDNKFPLPLETVRKAFVYNYCRTCHSFQGLSVDKAITIYDWKCEWASRKWIYTAVTRARRLDQVFFLDYQEKSQKDKIMRYMRQKVEGYKYQDRKGKKAIDEKNYVTAEWLYGQLGKSCHNNCSDCLVASVVNGTVECNLTAQRLNNDIAHHMDNVIPFCVECNVALSNRG
jgi:hypothetical protein